MIQERKRSIRGKLLLIVLLPIILLSIIITIVGIILFYGVYTGSIHDELVSTTNMMFDCLELADRGDYTYKDGMLLKGNLNLTDSTMLRRAKEESQIDTTIFWEDTRILTTVEDEQGISAVGTKASEEVVRTVLGDGKSFFSERLDIGGIAYIGYYAPIENSDHEIVGMMFAGKQKNLVYRKIQEVIFDFAVLSAAIILMTVFIVRKFSFRLTMDIDNINDYLKKISEGDLRISLAEGIVKREDELGTIGFYASVMREKLQKLVERDPLTDLYNRRMCHNFLKELVEEHENYCVIMCDIDHFKEINDNYGHDTGDYVLVELSELFKENVKGTGFAGRWGGEEFLLIYKLDFEKAKERAEELQRRIWEHNFSRQGAALKVFVTFGVAEGEEGVSYEKIIKKADEKLYFGKNNGRNQIVY